MYGENPYYFYLGLEAEKTVLQDIPPPLSLNPIILILKFGTHFCIFCCSQMIQDTTQSSSEYIVSFFFCQFL